MLKDAPFAHLLSFGAAIRFSDYSTIGNDHDLEGRRRLCARSATCRSARTYSQAVRAPNIAELFSPASSSFNFIVDPCDIGETQQWHRATARRIARRC